VASFDVIVTGLGGMGSAAAAHLAARGERVLGLEQFQPGHALGSSHGRSRVIRLAYFEDPAYVPLLLRAYELWEQLEKDSGRSVLTITGGLMIGAPDSDVVSGSLRSAREHGLAHELLDAAEIRRRFPAFTPAPGVVAFHETRAGVLRPEAAIHAHLDRARSGGADLRFDQRVIDWQSRPSGGVEVQTATDRYEADRLVIAPGAWAPEMFRLPLPLEVEPRELFWFAPTSGADRYSPDRFPIYIWDLGGGVQFYGFPADEAGVKVAFFRTGGGVNELRAALGPRLPGLASGAVTETVTCKYTLTPDHHFVLGLHPRHADVVIASPCSGHGYKFASVVGEVLADLAIDGTTRHPIGLFSPARFQ
jgi:sarcosine oxidase